MGCFNRSTKRVRTIDEAFPRIHVLSFGSCIALRHRVGPQVFELLVQLVLRHLCRTSPPGPRAVVRPRAPPAPIAESWKFDQKCPRKSKLGQGAAFGRRVERGGSERRWQRSLRPKWRHEPFRFHPRAASNCRRRWLSAAGHVVPVMSGFDEFWGCWSRVRTLLRRGDNDLATAQAMKRREHTDHVYHQLNPCLPPRDQTVST